MGKYIPLDSVVMEINRQIELLKPLLGACAGQILAEANAKLSVLEGLKNFLETLEVKEVANTPNIRFPHYKSIVEKVFGAGNLESFEYDEAEQLVSLAKEELLKDLEVKEVDLEHLEQEVKDFCYKFDERKDKWYDMTPHDQNLMVSPTFANFAIQLAKHFFELGVCVSNPITAQDRGTAEEIIINLKQVENDYLIDLTKEIEWVRNQVKKGE